ncbi:MAG: sulfur oxidation c-type cytochrome SoxA [Beijerinckiaceae bacterium]
MSAPQWLNAEEIPAAQRQSGYEIMTGDTRAMQDNDRANPAMLWAAEGERLWATPAGNNARACSSCHGDAKETMRGIAARYPAFDEKTNAPIDLQNRIRACQTNNQQIQPAPYESRTLLALTIWISTQSRSMPITPDRDPRLAPFSERGKELFTQRSGQLNFSCQNCHDDNWGKKLGASTIPQAHPTGYPIYRLEWQGAGSLQRRLRNCMTGVRAEPYAYGAPEMIALELYLMQRATGMRLETPAVRP